MWLQIIIIIISILGLILTWTKSVKKGDRPINIAVTIVAVIFIIAAIYSLCT